MKIEIIKIEDSHPVNMEDGEILYAIRENATGKFVEWVSGKGSITYRKNPFLANYFIYPKYAGWWMEQVKLDPTKFTVVGFEKVMTDNERYSRELDNFMFYGELPKE